MPGRLDEYFAAEAREYVEQLEGLVSAEEPGDPERILRLATGVRGSARMAGGHDLAGLAASLESASARIADGDLAWDRRLRDLYLRTLEGIRSLLPAIDGWSSEEARRVADLIAEWNAYTPMESTSDARPVVPIESLFYDDAGPHILDGPGSPGIGPQVVPIERLLFRGEDAVKAAIALRPAFEEIARGGIVPSESLSDLVDELFDLLDLSLTTEPAEA